MLFILWRWFNVNGLDDNYEQWTILFGLELLRSLQIQKQIWPMKSKYECKTVLRKSVWLCVVLYTYMVYVWLWFRWFIQMENKQFWNIGHPINFGSLQFCLMANGFFLWWRNFRYFENKQLFTLCTQLISNYDSSTSEFVTNVSAVS